MILIFIRKGFRMTGTENFKYFWLGFMHRNQFSSYQVAREEREID